MWRRFGDVAFAAVVAVAVTLEAVPLAILTWVLLGRRAGSEGLPSTTVVLIGATATTAVGLAMVTVYLLAYQSVSARRETRQGDRRSRWVARWLEVLYGGQEPPPGPLAGASLEALLDLRETLRGAEAGRIDALLRRDDAVQALTREARMGRTPRRLEALDALSRARMAEAMPALLAGIEDTEHAVRVASTRAAARTLASIDDPVVRDTAAHAFVSVLERARLPFGVIEEALLLSEDAAPSLLGGLLLREDGSTASLRAALDAIARLQLLVFGEEAVRFLAHPDPEVRAAALRAVARIGLLPPEARPTVLMAMRDEVDFVRIHAASAARLLPRAQATSALWEALGDRSWWVRRASAEALADLGPPGLGELGDAALDHPDRYARDMAAQTLRDRALTIVEAVAG